MKTTGTYLIYRSDTNEFLAERAEGTLQNVLAWCEHPGEALRYTSVGTIESVAREMVKNLGATLTVCELFESSAQYLPQPLTDIFAFDPELN